MPSDTTAPKVWVLWWRYSDGSATEIMRAYYDERRAAADYALVSMDTSRIWAIEELQVTH